MNLSSLVHAGRTQAEQQQRHNHHYHNHIHQEPQPQPSRVMSSSQIMNPYMSRNESHKSTYPCIIAPQPPPSPPADENPKCSLPSISSLLVLVDTSTPQEHNQFTQPYNHNGEFASFRLTPGHTHQNNYFEMGNQKYGSSPPINSRSFFPLTPPLHSETGFDGRQSSPSVTSSSETSVSSVSNYELASSLSSSEFSLTNQSESSDQHRHTPSTESRFSLSTQTSPRTQNSTIGGDNQYRSSPQRLNPFHPSPMQSNRSNSSEISGLSYQRPLPQFSPSSMPILTPIPQISPANPWQHHHYISPSSTASFPQTQDRYICQTCNKAFSRPSSLRIHTHSHTGAKPFKCPHIGCGKAFSVRSNMKRHERGCHSSDNS